MGMTALEVEDIEVSLLLEAVSRRWGVELRDYARASLVRRVRAAVKDEGVETISALQSKLLHDAGALDRFLPSLTRNETGLFQDAAFFLELRRRIVPILETYPFIRIWHAGCSFGEGVLATAIILEEEGLLERARIYATDASAASLRRAKQASFPLALAGEAARSYREAGGKRTLDDHYEKKGADAVFRSSLLGNVVFAAHNMATDGSFNEFNLILCRNHLIYMNRDLTERAHRLLYQSLGMFGILALGERESVRGSPHAACYEEVSPRRLYRRVR